MQVDPQLLVGVTVIKFTAAVAGPPRVRVSVKTLVPETHEPSLSVIVGEFPWSGE